MSTSSPSPAPLPAAAPRVYLLCKTPGPSSKTRLSPFLPPASRLSLARAMLLDTLLLLPALQARSACYFAPAASLPSLQALLSPHPSLASLPLLPMPPGSGPSPLTGSDLSPPLSHALSLHPSAPAVFLGSDAPHLPPPLLARALELAKAGTAFLAPAEDGGFVLLALPAGTPPEVFEGVAWSEAHTAASMAARVLELGIPLRIHGTAVGDVDELEDVEALAARGDVPALTRGWLDEHGFRGGGGRREKRERRGGKLRVAAGFAAGLAVGLGAARLLARRRR